MRRSWHGFSTRAGDRVHSLPRLGAAQHYAATGYSPPGGISPAPDAPAAATRLWHSATNHSAEQDSSFPGTMMSYPVMACFALSMKPSSPPLRAGLFFNLMQINSARVGVPRYDERISTYLIAATSAQFTGPSRRRTS